MAINFGIGLIIFYILASWLFYWLFRKGNYTKIFKPHFKDLNIDLGPVVFSIPFNGASEETPIFWNDFLINILVHSLLLYVVWIVVISIFG